LLKGGFFSALNIDLLGIYYFKCDMWLYYCVIGLSDALPAPVRRGRPPKYPKYMHVPTTKSAGAILSSVPRTRSTNSMQFSSPKTGDLTAKTIIKGNIIYKRTETGEVIASVVKNGPKPVASTIAAASANRGRPPSDARTIASLCVAGETSLPTDCQVNEDNVERILDESVTATHSVRRTLVSLKDDLRRMGGGAVMSPALKPIHLQHRINIAYKLARAFADYRSTMSNISGAKSACSTVTSHQQTARPTDVPPHTVSVVNSAPVTCCSQSNAALVKTLPRQKIATSTAETVPKQTSVDVMNVVSDDLWMSCESGPDTHTD